MLLRRDKVCAGQALENRGLEAVERGAEGCVLVEQGEIAMQEGVDYLCGSLRGFLGRRGGGGSGHGWMCGLRVSSGVVVEMEMDGRGVL